MLGIKLFAAAAVVAAGMALGLQRAQQLSRRCAALQDALLLLRLIRVRIQGGRGLWLTEIADVAQSASFAVLRFEKDIQERQSLADTLHEYLAAAQAPQLLGACACEWLHSALECAVTRQETAARLDYYCHLLEDAFDGACVRQAKDGKLYLQLGPLAGALLAVILW